MTSRIKIDFNLNTSAIICVLVPPTLTLAFKIPLTRFIRTKKWWWHSQGLVSSLNCYTRDLQGTWYCTSSLKLQWLSSLEDFWTVSITVYPSGISFKVSFSKLQKRVQKATHSPLQYKSLFATFVKIHTPWLSHWLYFSLISPNIKYLCQLRLNTTNSDASLSMTQCCIIYETTI